MEKYKVKIKKSAQKDILSFPKKEIKKILSAIEDLAINPRGANCKKLSGEEKYRKRVGNYRILYQIEDDVLVVNVVKVAHRKEVYR